MRILAVDDDPILIDMLKGLLDRAGFDNVTYCFSAQEALDHLNNGAEVDCFLLDINMPGKDGIALCREIRQMPRHGETPIIMLTLACDQRSVRKAYDAGATEYVTKPFDGLALGSRIRTAYKLKLAHARAQEWAEAASQIAVFPQDAVRAISGEIVPYLGVCRAMEFYQLENFLLRLEFGLYSTSILSIMIEGLSDHFERLDDLPQQQQIIASVLRTIADVSNPDGLVSYAGEGVFVCVNLDRKLLKADMLREELRATLLRALPVSSDTFDTRFGINVIRNCQRTLLSGRKAADLLRSSVSRSKTVQSATSSEAELSKLFREDTRTPAFGVADRIVPRRLVAALLQQTS